MHPQHPVDPHPPSTSPDSLEVRGKVWFYQLRPNHSDWTLDFYVNVHITYQPSLVTPTILAQTALATAKEYLCNHIHTSLVLSSHAYIHLTICKS